VNDLDLEQRVKKVIAKTEQLQEINQGLKENEQILLKGATSHQNRLEEADRLAAEAKARDKLAWEAQHIDVLSKVNVVPYCKCGKCIKII